MDRLEASFLKEKGKFDPLSRRIAQKFAFLDATIGIAERAKLLPIAVADMQSALDEIFDRVVKLRSAREIEQAEYNLGELDKLVSKRGYPRLEIGKAPLKEETAKANVCFVRKARGEKMIYFHAQSFIAAAGVDTRSMAEAFTQFLKDNILLFRTSESASTRPVTQEGLVRRRYLCFSLRNAVLTRNKLQSALTRRR